MIISCLRGFNRPFSSILAQQFDLKPGLLLARRTLARIHGPTALRMASGRCLPLRNDLAQTRTAALAVSVLEDLAEGKAVYYPLPG